jgi:hypothetical protein
VIAFFGRTVVDATVVVTLLGFSFGGRHRAEAEMPLDWGTPSTSGRAPRSLGPPARPGARGRPGGPR